MSSKKTHILVIRLSALGDVAMVATVLRIFVNQHPEVKITFLSKGFLKPLFTEIPNVNFYEAETNGKHKGFLGIYKLFKELKELHFDAIADLHDVLRSNILKSFFFGLKSATIDKGRAEKKALTRPKNKVFKQLKTTHERYADVFRKLGFSLDLNQIVFPEKKALSEEIIKISGKKERHQKWIGIAPFAQYETKMYPLDLMKKVILELSQQKDFKVFLFGGGKHEITILNEVVLEITNTITVAGNLKLNQELDLISHLDVMLAMDSGNAHLAAMQGIKTVTIWGNTHPFAGFTPFNQPIDYAFLPDVTQYPKLPTSVFGNKKVDGYLSVMNGISPYEISKKIISIATDLN